MRAGTYLDTAVFVKGYIPERDSDRATAILQAEGFPLLFSHFHEVEIPNAIRLKRFRGEIGRNEENVAIRLFRDDIKAGRLVRANYDLAEVFRRTESLSAKYSGDVGSRSLDLLHVAVALEAGCRAFASFDDRQRTVAAACGLALIPTPIPVRKRNGKSGRPPG